MILFDELYFEYYFEYVEDDDEYFFEPPVAKLYIFIQLLE